MPLYDTLAEKIILNARTFFAQSAQAVSVLTMDVEDDARAEEQRRKERKELRKKEKKEKKEKKKDRKDKKDKKDKKEKKDKKVRAWRDLRPR